MSLQEIINEQRTIVSEQSAIREEFDRLVARIDAEFKREVQRITQRLDTNDGRIRKLTGEEDAALNKGLGSKAPPVVTRAWAPGGHGGLAPKSLDFGSPRTPPGRTSPGAPSEAPSGQKLVRQPLARGAATTSQLDLSAFKPSVGRTPVLRTRSPLPGAAPEKPAQRSGNSKLATARKSEKELADTRSALAQAEQSRGHGWEEPAESKAKPSAIDQCENCLRVAIEKSKEYRRFPNNPVQGLQQLFQRLDRNHSGKVDVSELEAVSKLLDFEADPKALASLFARYDLDRSGYLTLDEFNKALFKLDKPGDLKAKSAIARMREVLSMRAGGYESLKAMGSQFRIIDRDHSGQLAKEEFELALDMLFSAYSVKFTQAEKNALFQRFDFDSSGTVSYDEFVRGVRGRMNDFRLGLVKQAFSVLDRSGSGVVGTQEMSRTYDVSQNPAVQRGELAPGDAILEFMKHYDTDGDGRITLDEFVENYQWVSSSIDGDDYFELMMRNAWHISGGEGWCENTANLRVLVQHNHGPDEVLEVKHDLGLPRDPAKKREEVIRRLQQQGVKDIQSIEFTG